MFRRDTTEGDASGHDKQTARYLRDHGYSAVFGKLGDEPIYRPPMVQIGITEVFTPSHVLDPGFPCQHPH